MINITKVSSKGQIVIPENMRKSLHLEMGCTLILRKVGNKIIMISEKDFEQEHFLSEQSLQKDWNNPKDEQEWKKYI
ncbi:MAG: AbrB/MazE/SpoVT family DNA-binding domain-containing protein [Candidatus Woesearchaeota archaeon]